jgi:hypothetical protein
MKQSKIFLLLIILLLPFAVLSQEKEKKEKEKKVRDHGLIFLIGPAINYHYGSKDGNTAYNDNKFSWQLDGQLGYLSTRHNTTRGNMLGVFGTVGSLSTDVLQELADHAGKGVNIKYNQFNQFFAVEGGMIIFNFIRLSGGLGRQYYENMNDKLLSINYYSLTGGLNFNFGAVNLGVNANLLTGNDLAENQLRFSAGILIKF